MLGPDWLGLDVPLAEVVSPMGARMVEGLLGNQGVGQFLPGLGDLIDARDALTYGGKAVGSALEGDWGGMTSAGGIALMAAMGAMPGIDAPPAKATDEALEAATRAGFDTDAYHATHADFDRFKLAAAGTGANAGAPGERAVFLTQDPPVADSYLGGGYVRADSGATGASVGDGVLRHYTEGARVMPLKVNTEGFDEWDFGGGGYRPEDIRRALAEARKAGAPGVVFKNIKDPGIIDAVGPVGNPRKPSTMIAVLDPRRIRSRFAKFDPAKKGSANILAGVAGLLGLPLLFPPDEAEASE